jgi:pimeloyl-ACP methyl ester carboxylesterase
MPVNTASELFQHKTVQLTPELRLHYVSAGDGERTVVLLHGFPQTWKAWRPVIPMLTAAGFRVIAPDYRGAGNSSRPLSGYDKSAPWRRTFTRC